MKKIMFNDRFGLTRKVLSGYKTQTRRIIPDIEIDWVRRGKVHLPVGGYEYGVLFMDVRSILHDAGISDYPAPAKYQPKYEKGEEIAVAQCYEDAILDVGEEEWNKLHKWYCIENLRKRAGLHNKMFVRPDLMPHRIKITDIRLQRLNNISDEECMREGVVKWKNCYIIMENRDRNKMCFDTPREAFTALIDCINGQQPLGVRLHLRAGAVATLHSSLFTSKVKPIKTTNKKYTRNYEREKRHYHQRKGTLHPEGCRLGIRTHRL